MSALTEMVSRSRATAGLAIATACVAMAGCGGSDEPTAAAEGSGPTETLKVGINPGFVPFEQLEGGKLVGLDVDLANELGKRLERKVEFDQQPFTSLVASVKSKRDDIAISGILDTPERRRAVDFSEPYVLDAFVLSVPKDDTTTKTLSDLEDETIAVQVGTVPEEFVREKLPRAKLVTTQDTPSAFDLVSQGRAAAVVTDAPVAGYYVEKLGGDLKLVPTPLGEAQPIAAIVPKGDALRAEVDSALAAMEADGTLPELRTKWFGRPDINTVPED